MSKTIFSKIIDGEILGTFVYRDERIVAIRDIASKAPTHILVIPIKPVVGVESATIEDQALLGDLLLVAARLARDLGLEASGYRLVINSGEDAGQTVPHLHVHLLGGRTLAWPPG